ERAGGPGPRRALVVTAVALRHATLVLRAIARLARREGPRSHRRPQLGEGRVDDLACAAGVQNRERQAAGGEDLIGPQRGVRRSRHVIHVDHVVEAVSLLVPEALAERIDTALE